MVSVNDIVAYLGYDPHYEGLYVDQLSKDGDAIAGCMSWTRDGIKQEFGGTLIFCQGNKWATFGERVSIGCDNPRLAFTRAANKFFPHLLEDKPVELLTNNTQIGKNTVLKNCIIGDNVIIGANCSIGFQGLGIEMGDEGYERFPHIGKVIIEDNVEIGSNVCIDRGSLGDTVIKSGVRVDNLVHIAHNAIIGHDTAIIANAMIAGSTVIGDNAWIGPGSSIIDGVTIGDNALVGIGAVVLSDVETGATMIGNPAKRMK